MSCLLCGSGNQAELTAEMVIHFSGLKNLDKPASGHSQAFGCLDCGCSHFAVPDRELASISRTLEISSPTWSRVLADVALSSGVASQSEVEIGSCLWVTDNVFPRGQFHGSEKVGLVPYSW
jgi:hypothetical protein